MKKEKLKILILAGGKGKRMESDIPKVLIPFLGKSIIKHVIDAVMSFKKAGKPYIVVNKDDITIQDSLKNEAFFTKQDEPKGTGHAVHSAKNDLKDISENIMVLYGDHPLITSSMIEKIFNQHIQSGNMLTMGFVRLKDYSEWRETFKDFGRIQRNKKGRIEKIIEKKDANESELLITEVNPSYFCFNANWLWKNLPKLNNNNNQKEYYLPDLVEIASSENSLGDIEISPKEALGVNTKDQLKNLENLVIKGII